MIEEEIRYERIGFQWYVAKIRRVPIDSLTERQSELLDLAAKSTTVEAFFDAVSASEQRRVHQHEDPGYEPQDPQEGR